MLKRQHIHTAHYAVKAAKLDLFDERQQNRFTGLSQDKDGGIQFVADVSTHAKL